MCFPMFIVCFVAKWHVILLNEIMIKQCCILFDILIIVKIKSRDEHIISVDY